MNNQNLMNTLCRNIRFLRIKNRLTQKQMADRLGISIGSLRKIEKDGAMPRVNGSLLLRVCDTFAISADALLYEDLAEAFLSQRL